MSEHEQQPREDQELERDETMQDLDVPAEQQDDVEGGRAPYKFAPDKH